MECYDNRGDHPLRMKASSSEIVHAVRKQPSHFGGRNNLMTACGHYPSLTDWIDLRDRPSITCKLCQKTLGITQTPSTNKRYIVYDGVMKLYFKRGRGYSFRGDWVKKLHEATRWRTEETADIILEDIITSRFRASESSQHFEHYKRDARRHLKVRPVKLWLELVD